MSGLTMKPSVGDWLYVFNDDDLFPGLPDGLMVWRGQVLSCVLDTGDPQTCRYRIWGPGGEQASVVPGKNLEWSANARLPTKVPSDFGTRHSRLTAVSLREGLNAALVRVAAGRGNEVLTSAAVCALRALVPHWEAAVAKGLLTVDSMERDVSALRGMLGAAVIGLLDKLVNKPQNQTNASSN